MSNHYNQYYDSCHYRALGVSKDATMEEIKTAFRRISMECHPDVAGATVWNEERFKRVAHAANILSNHKHRQEYDNQIRNNSTYNSFYRGGFNKNSTFHHTDQTKRSQYYNNNTARGQPKGVTGVLVNVFRPRNMILGPIVLYCTVSALQYSLGIETQQEKKQKRMDVTREDCVQAWKNPKSGLWETPAPWDPQFRQLQPKLEYVPRDQVHTRHQ